MASTTIFSFTTFLAAFLLFWIQPLISKYILPWFGGTSAVWSTALLFFQSLLMAGYAYAHLVSSLSRRRLIAYAFLLGASVVAILVNALSWDAPLLPGVTWKPPDASLPLLRILVVLLVSIGLPYFVLATTSPLLQTWHRLLKPDRSPFRLYALSSLGSFLALISFPFLFEPLLNLQQQSSLWAAGFLIYVILCARLLIKVTMLTSQKSQPEKSQVRSAQNPVRIEESATDIPTRKQKIVWIILPAISSILLIAVTNQLTQEVAVVPFLWVLPLSLYLLSFTITFAEGNAYKPGWVVILLAISLLVLSFVIENAIQINILIQIFAYCFFLFIATVFIHGELYQNRPPDHSLTSFYLLVSLGSVIGAVFVNLVAPLIFEGFWELQLAMLACWILVLVLVIGNRNSPYYQGENRLVIYAWLFVMGITSVIAFEAYSSTRLGTLYSQRNFYGITRVRRVMFDDVSTKNVLPENTTSAYQEIESNMLSHGATTHGFQFLAPDWRTTPTAYFGPHSGIGLALTHYPEVRANSGGDGLRIGVIGLGIGTLAAYGQPGDRFYFYEINPAMIDLAQGTGGYFSFLQDTAAEVEIIPGDARLALERDLQVTGSREFDILAMDAFNGDSIPVHLLTIQAVNLYLQHIKPGGVLAVNISNRFINLAPMLFKIAEHFELGIIIIHSNEERPASYPAVWALLSTNQAFFERTEIQKAADPPPEIPPEARLWTDDYSNLLPYLQINMESGKQE